MPSPLASSANAQTQNAGGSTTRAPRSDGNKEFSQLLQGGTPASPAPAPATPASPGTSTPSPPSAADGNGQAPEERSADADATPGEAPALPPLPSMAGGPGTDKDKPNAAEDAPWPPLGLAGLVLAMPTPTDPAVARPSAAAAGAPTLASDGTALPAATGAALPATAPATVATAAADNKPSAASTDDAAISSLPEMILPGGKRGDRGEGSDPATIGDRGAAPLLHAPAPAALQDLKAALTAGNAVFNGEPTPKPVLGDDGFDQAIGARLGWLADQKIGHAHIRLSPDDMGPVDVRLQLNGDKVHASFSSPHVDVRQALESSLPRLRELLGEQGFQLAHADVGHQAPGGDGNASGQSGAGGMAGDGEPSPGDTSVSSAQLIRQRGLLDAYA
ncbi:flagellar hook-length control protein FliK [Stenotrophomonas maltophilia]|uniref:flagellar hook-length control protein FliK n=1 Tax=Stenotrophomonas maltophilia TaxID=40324 RepID=UPI000DA922EC|nr:flagellar hook-length control protein FliK [Stenotrophomonas maltophilia]PZS73706.1 flagellar hook-length control protein [Stenotrophomonas maltophilia]